MNPIDVSNNFSVRDAFRYNFGTYYYYFIFYTYLFDNITRGGMVDPLSCFFDVNGIATQLSKATGQKVEPQLGQLIDFNSQYPATLVHHNIGPFKTPIEYVPIPNGNHTILWGTECNEVCPTSCPDRSCGRQDDHDCDEGINCWRLCTSHHSFEDFGKAPAAIQVTLLPPKSERNPIIRISLQDING
jgi:hypothetical protein